MHYGWRIQWVGNSQKILKKGKIIIIWLQNISRLDLSPGVQTVFQARFQEGTEWSSYSM